ncbi:MAG: fibronectin type III domain-containing protein [Bacteroidota bacterium]
MAKKAKVKLDFLELDVPAKIQYSRDRTIDMQAAPAMTTPDVAYATMEGDVDDLEIKWQAFEGGGQGTEEALNTSEETHDNNWRLQTDFVNRIARGSVDIITSKGFTATSTERHPAQIPGQVKNFRLERGKENGSVKALYDGVVGAKSYVAICTTEANLNYSFVNNQLVLNNVKPVIVNTNTRTEKNFTNLESGTRVYIFVFAINSAGRGPESSIANIIVP